MSERVAARLALPWVGGLTIYLAVYQLGSIALPSPLLEAVTWWVVWLWTGRHYTRSGVWGSGLSDRRPLPAVAIYGLGWVYAIPLAALMVRFWERTAPWVVELLEVPWTPGQILAAITLVPIIEEMVFRGFLFRAWTHRMGIRRSVLVTSLVFGLAHPHDPLGAFTFGVAACALRVRYGTLWVPVLVHAVFNLGAVLLGFALEGLEAQTGSAFAPLANPLLLVTLSALGVTASLLYAARLIARSGATRVRRATCEPSIPDVD
jgi:membrane protease YdiL (CAAX protease family)